MNYFTNFPESNFMTEFEIVEIDNEITRMQERHEENNIMANQVINQILQFDFHPDAGLIPWPGYPQSSASEGEEEDSKDDIIIEEFDIEDETVTEEEEEEKEEEENEEEGEEEEEDELKFYTPLPQILKTVQIRAGLL